MHFQGNWIQDLLLSVTAFKGYQIRKWEVFWRFLNQLDVSQVFGFFEVGAIGGKEGPVQEEGQEVVGSVVESGFYQEAFFQDLVNLWRVKDKVI